MLGPVRVSHIELFIINTQFRKIGGELIEKVLPMIKKIRMKTTNSHLRSITQLPYFLISKPFKYIAMIIISML